MITFIRGQSFKAEKIGSSQHKSACFFFFSKQWTRYNLSNTDDFSAVIFDVILAADETRRRAGEKNGQPLNSHDLSVLTIYHRRPVTCVGKSLFSTAALNIYEHSYHMAFM